MNYVLAAEVLALARRAGIDTSQLPAALKGGMADSQILRRIYPQMEAEDFDPPKAFARQLAKDLRALCAFAEEHGGDFPVSEAAVEVYDAFVQDGHGTSDSAAISQRYSRRND